MALVVEQSPPVGKPGRIGNFRVSPPDCGRDVTGLHVSQEKPVLDFSVFTWDENRTPIRRPPYRSPDKSERRRKVALLARLKRANRDDLWAVSDQAWPTAGNVGKKLTIWRPRRRKIRTGKPLGRFLCLCHHHSGRRIIPCGENIAAADHKAVVEGTGPRKPYGLCLSDVLLDQVGRALRFPIRHALEPRAHGSRTVAGEEDVVAVRRPAQ